MHVPAFALALLALAASTAAQQLDKPFRVQAGGKPIDVDLGHAAPYFADFDGDRVRDLIVGQYGKGRCRVYKNVGSNREPRFETFSWLEAGGDVAYVDGG